MGFIKLNHRETKALIASLEEIPQSDLLPDELSALQKLRLILAMQVNKDEANKLSGTPKPERRPLRPLRGQENGNISRSEVA